MSKLVDRIAALEALLAPPPVEPALMFTVPVSLRLLADWHGEVERARASCGQPLAVDATPLLDGEPEAWEQYAIAQQAKLIGDARGDVDRALAREADRIAAEHAAKHPPKPQRKHKPPPVFTPSVFARN